MSSTCSNSPASAFCHRCGRNTQTALINLRSGLIGNCCATCRACRKGMPYAGRWDRTTTRHDTGATGQGVHNEDTLHARI